MQLVSLLLAFAAGAFVMNWYARRSARREVPKVPPMYMVLWDGHNVRFSPASWVDKNLKPGQEGLEVEGCGQVLPAGSLSIYHGPDVSIVAAAFDQATLKDNSALQRSRVSIVLSELTSGGGSVRGLLGMVAPLVTIAAVVLLYFQASGANAAQQDTLKSLGVVEKILSEPLACSMGGG